MIKVNLAGSKKKESAKAGTTIALPKSVTPILLVLIVLGSAAVGYSWYATLTSESANLDDQIGTLEARRLQLEAVIKQDQVYESRKKMLENRVRIIETLQKNQVSPVFVLDQLADAVQKTQFVWLSSLDQKDAMLTMSGTGTSLNAIADFYTNLNATGYFRNIDLGPSQENSGNFSFSLKCEFSPPRGAPSDARSTRGGD